MISSIFALYAVANLALFAWALILLLRCPRPSIMPLLIVIFGLVYDNAALAAGRLLGHGELLQILTVPRFFMHAFGTPLLMLTALGLMRRQGPAWARTTEFAAFVSALTLMMIFVGVDRELFHLRLYPKQTGDLVSYGNAVSQGAPLAPIVTTAVLIIAGALLWRHRREPWLLVGATLQLGVALIGDAIVVAGNFGELALLASLVASESRSPRDET
jgi:hypothetical protein